MSKNRTLFLSFSRLLRALKNNEVSFDSLEAGLFIMGPERVYALDPDKHGDRDQVAAIWYDNLEEGRRVHGRLREALLRAENEGRVLWKEPGSFSQTWEQVDEFLLRHGYLPESNSEIEQRREGEACHIARLALWLQENEIQLDIHGD